MGYGNAGLSGFKIVILLKYSVTANIWAPQATVLIPPGSATYSPYSSNWQGAWWA